ncbi:hypothetical protein C4588_03330 [Candidatus Parcubacteria bacterium]|nr:MAG: hypothetical protein C4588_03330 [Candidatus Parcubacteria bacterium]
MAYTPELSQKHSCTLRRIAWALNRPMTQAIEEVFNYLATVMDHRRVCTACRDKTRCIECAFYPKRIQPATKAAKPEEVSP